MTRKLIAILSVACVLAAALTIGANDAWPEFGGILTGWFYFLRLNIGEATVYRNAILNGLVCFLLFVGCVHLLGRVWFRSKTASGTTAIRWKFRWTASIIALVLIMFVAGFSTVALARQTGWLLLMKHRGPLYVELVDGHWEDF